MTLAGYKIPTVYETAKLTYIQDFVKLGVSNCRLLTQTMDKVHEYISYLISY
jgi:hypothetical protein